MLQNKTLTVIFYTFIVLILLGLIKFISHGYYTQQTPLKITPSYQPPVVAQENTSPLTPVSDEENLFIGVEIPIEVTESPTSEKSTVPAPESLTQPTEKPKCPAGNLLSGYSDLSPVSPTFGLDYYRPDDLVVIPPEIPTPKTICIRKGTLNALLIMYEAMKLENLKPMIVSGFRSSTHQKNIQENNISQALSDGTVVRSVALPHHSEHQLGTTVDFAAAPSYNIRDFEKSLEYAWMIEHADEYGFIQSYHYGDEHDTGYRGEPWHWRYIGPTRAQSVISTGKILFQYLEELVENSEIKKP